MAHIMPLMANIVLVLLYSVGVVLSFVLAKVTPDRKTRNVRYITVFITLTMMMMSFALLIEQNERFTLLSSDLVKHVISLHLTDITVVLSLVAVVIQLYGARDKIRHMTKIFYEIHQLRTIRDIDPLTGLLNRRALSEMLEAPNCSYWSIIMIDIDDFKKVNDTKGHVEGDNVLRTISQCILRIIRPEDLAYRFGGEEVAVVCPNTALYDGTIMAQQICDIIGSDTCTTASIGVAAGDLSIGLLKTITQADVALYEAKRQGKNRVAMFPNGVYLA